MTTLTITLEIPEDADPKADTFNGAGVTWERFLGLLKTYTPANKSLSIRTGLDGNIKASLMIGELTIEVTDPYVAPKVYAPGTVARHTSTGTTYVKAAGEGWVAVYKHSDHSETSHRADSTVEGRIADGNTVVIFDPTQN
jgi:hypothetical protein